jgi:hypothetical protein
METDICKTPNEPQESGYESTINTIFQRIVTDVEFKALLLSDADSALAEYNLSDTQLLMIKSLSEDDLNKLTPENLEEYFAADAAVYTPDEADLVDYEEYNPDDFEEL